MLSSVDQSFGHIVRFAHTRQLLLVRRVHILLIMFTYSYLHCMKRILVIYVD